MMADEERDRDNYIEAIKLYRDALVTYMKLAKNYPDWQPGVTHFRIVYCNNQLEALLQKTDEKNLASIPEPSRTDDSITREVSIATTKGTKTDTISPGNMIPNKTKIEKIKSEARILMEKGDIEKARSMLLNGLQLEPDDQNIRMLLGLVHCRTNQFDNAVYLIEPLVQEDPSNTYARILLGTAYFGLGKIQDATKQMKEALTINPKSAEAHYNLAQLLLISNPVETNAARKHYKSALELGAKPDTNLNFLLLEPAPNK